MKYIRYLSIFLVALVMVSFTSNQKQRKIKSPDKAPFGHVQWVHEVTYHAIEDSSGNITKGDVISDTDYDAREIMSNSNMLRKTPPAEPPIQIWMYDEYGDEIQNDKFHANGMLW